MQMGKKKISTASTKMVFLILLGCLNVYPVIWMISGSFKSIEDLFGKGLSLLPSSWNFQNYVEAWVGANFGRYFFNTLIVATSVTVLMVLITAMAGYVLGLYRIPGKKIILGLLALTMFLPGGLTIIPVFRLVHSLGLLDSLAGIILASLSGGLVMYTLLFMSYFGTLNKELAEAACIDGAGFWRTFYNIMLPSVKPMGVTVGLFTFLGNWNSFFLPLVLTVSRPELRTLAVGVYSFFGEYDTQWNLICAASTISLIPVILLFLLLQRHFVEGMAGAVKG